MAVGCVVSKHDKVQWIGVEDLRKFLEAAGRKPGKAKRKKLGSLLQSVFPGISLPDLCSAAHPIQSAAPNKAAANDYTPIKQ